MSKNFAKWCISIFIFSFPGVFVLCSLKNAETKLSAVFNHPEYFWCLHFVFYYSKVGLEIAFQRMWDFNGWLL